MVKENKSPVKAISLMMVITLAAKLLGLWRDRLLAISYGTGMEANAFLMASRIPRVFFDVIFASAIAACFIPVFNEYLTRSGKKEAFKFSGNFITVVGILTFGITALGMIFAEPLTAFLADGYDAETMALCVKLTQMMFPTVLFTGIAYCFVGILQSSDEFNIPAFISVVSNAVVIVYFYVFNDKFGITGLAIAFLIAWLAQAIIQIPSLRKKHFEFYPSPKFNTDGMKKVFTLVIPVMVSTWVLPINQIVNAKFGSHLFDGAGVSAIELSYNLYLIIVGVFVLSVTNFIFPRMSKQAAGNDTEGFKHTISATMHTSLFVVVPMMVGMMLMSSQLVEFIYGGGEFGAFSIEITSRSLFFVSLGMVGYAIQAVLSRAFFAEQSGKVPLIAGAAAILSNIVLCILLVDRFDVSGLAIASAVSSTVNAIILIIPLHRKGIKFADKAFLKDMVKIVLAALIMAAAVMGLNFLMSGVAAEGVGKAVRLFVPALGGVIVYFISTLVLRLGETQLAISYIKKLVRKGG